MRSRFFTLASSFCLLVAVTGNTQSNPSPAPRVGYIRFWDMAPPESGTFEVRKIGTPDGQAMLTSKPYQHSGYTQFPLGRYRLGVAKKGDSALLKVFDVDLRADTFFTILVSPQSVEIFDDTNDPRASSGTIVIRNFFPRVTVSAATETKNIVPSLAYGQSFTATGFPLNRIELLLQTKLSNGQPAGAGAEVDFKLGSKATVLIIPDSYGRFRPRTTIDGKNP